MLDDKGDELLDDKDLGDDELSDKDAVPGLQYRSGEVNDIERSSASSVTLS